MKKILIYESHVLQQNKVKTLNVTCILEPSVLDRICALFRSEPQPSIREEDQMYIYDQQWFGPNSSSTMCDEDTSAILNQFLAKSSTETGTKLIGIL